MLAFLHHLDGTLQHFCRKGLVVVGQYSTCVEKDCFFFFWGGGVGGGGGGSTALLQGKLTKTLYCPYKSNLFGGRHCDSRIHRKFYFMASIKEHVYALIRFLSPHTRRYGDLPLQAAFSCQHAAIATSTAFASTNVGRVGRGE